MGLSITKEWKGLTSLFKSLNSYSARVVTNQVLSLSSNRLRVRTQKSECMFVVLVQERVKIIIIIYNNGYNNGYYSLKIMYIILLNITI